MWYLIGNESVIDSGTKIRLGGILFQHRHDEHVKMSSETRSRLDAALNATHESVQHILRGWQRHEDAKKALSEAKDAVEAELARLHLEMADWHEKVNELLRPIVEQISKDVPAPSDPLYRLGNLRS